MLKNELPAGRRMVIKTERLCLTISGPATIEFEELLSIEPEGLTKKETEVFEHLRRGKVNKEIASKLGIETRTAKFHVSNILQKLGCDSRTEVIRRHGVTG